jgi:hypothetical protein
MPGEVAQGDRNLSASVAAQLSRGDFDLRQSSRFDAIYGRSAPDTASNQGTARSGRSLAQGQERSNLLGQGRSFSPSGDLGISAKIAGPLADGQSSPPPPLRRARGALETETTTPQTLEPNTLSMQPRSRTIAAAATTDPRADDDNDGIENQFDPDWEGNSDADESAVVEDGIADTTPTVGEGPGFYPLSYSPWANEPDELPIYAQPVVAGLLEGAGIPSLVSLGAAGYQYLTGDTWEWGEGFAAQTGLASQSAAGQDAAFVSTIGLAAVDVVGLAGAAAARPIVGLLDDAIPPNATNALPGSGADNGPSPGAPGSRPTNGPQPGLDGVDTTPTNLTNPTNVGLHTLEGNIVSVPGLSPDLAAIPPGGVLNGVGVNLSTKPTLMTVPTTGNSFTVGVHGSTNGHFTGGQGDVYSPTAVAQAMIASGYQAGQPITLMSCHSACSGTATNLLGALEDLGVAPGTLQAPNDLVNGLGNVANDGSWFSFGPHNEGLPVPTPGEPMPWDQEWFTDLSPAQQQQIRDNMAALPGAAVAPLSLVAQPAPSDSDSDYDPFGGLHVDSETLLGNEGPLGFGSDFAPSVPLEPFDPGGLDFSPSLPLDFGNTTPSAPTWGGDIGDTYTPGQAASLANDIREDLTGAFTPEDWADFEAAGIADLVEDAIDGVVRGEVETALTGKTERRPQRPSSGDGDGDGDGYSGLETNSPSNNSGWGNDPGGEFGGL